MTDHAPDRIWSGIDIPKTIAGVLAALSAAVLGSFLGVAGTIVGAAVASLVGSVGTEIYHRWIDRSHKKLKQTFVMAPAAMGTPPVAAAEDESPSDEPVVEAGPAPRTPVRWGRVAALAAAVFVLAMGALTAFELLAHRTVADAVGNSSSSSTTFGSVFSGNDSSEDPQPAPSGSASETDGTAPTTAPATADPTAPATDGTQPADPGTTTEPADPGTTPTPAPAEETGQPDAATLPGGEDPPADGSR